MIDPFLFNTLVEGTAEGRYGVMSELLAFQFATFASIPSLVVWLKGSSREAGMPVAAGALLGKVMSAVAGVLHGLLAISFARWILKGGKAARKTKTA
ncbi:hypothetical protein BC831DRAFT_552718 [Entophlyctis helioformis]|nr:hypothetical protein BC831DRAFT_552718 [Entophlyctis helioformis]